MEIRRQRLRGRAGPATAGPVSRARVEKVSTPASAASADARMKALDKKAARVIRNREVALRARQAAKTKMKNLESENCNLKSRATTLEIENSTLKSQIEMLRRNAGPNVSPWNDPTFEGVVGAITQ